MELTIVLNPIAASLSSFNLDTDDDFSRNARPDLSQMASLERKARLKRLSEQVDEVKDEISGKKKKKKVPAPADGLGDDTNAFGSEDTDFETDSPGGDADGDEHKKVDSGDDEEDDSDDGEDDSDDGDDEDF
jgi:hypothetical protein